MKAMALPQITSIGFTCRHTETTADFYCRHLGFEPAGSCTLEPGAYAALLGLPGSRLKLQRLRLALF